MTTILGAARPGLSLTMTTASSLRERARALTLEELAGIAWLDVLEPAKRTRAEVALVVA